MNFETTQTKNEAVVKTNVEKLDASNAPELKAELVLLNKNGVNNIIIDLAATKYCDSSGLSAVLTANRLCKDTNGRFVLCGLQENVFKLIQIAQLDKVLSIAAGQEEALEVIHQ
ncbi:MAG: STAS domain-containing protein [Flavobacteriia bacterium]|jgi:anti-sigma B factor antagonist